MKTIPAVFGTDSLQDRCPNLDVPCPLLLPKDLTSFNRKIILQSYFNRQRSDYVAELDWFAELNGFTGKRPEVMVFVPCYNEDANLLQLIKLYQKQDIVRLDENSVIVVIVVNAPKPGNSSNDDDRYLESVRQLKEKSKECRWLHIVAKRFPRNLACLGRARKYGLDYCMRLAARVTTQVDF